MADKKKSKFSFRKLIYNDKYLIIISIILALVIWCVTSINLSPETEKTITVPVAVDFTDTAASQLGIRCYGEESINVDVTITCKKYLAKDITADNLNVYLQTSAVTSNGNLEVPIKVETSEAADFKVQSYYPTVYRAYFDVEDEKVMDIDVQFDNDDYIEEGYVKGEAVFSESNITVRGPHAYLSSVDRIVSTVSFDGKLKTTQTVNLNLNAVDKSGESVKYISFVTKNDNVTMTIPVLKKTVLNVTSSFNGKPTGVNVADFGIAYSVNSVNAGVLEDAAVNQANIGSINFSQLTVGNNVFKFDTNKIESFVVLDNINEITATVTVPDTYKTASLNVSGKNVDIVNVPAGYKAELVSLSSYSVTAVGKEENLTALKDSSVKLLVDLSSVKSDNLKEGVESYNITATLNANDSCWIYGDYTAKLRLYK